MSARDTIGKWPIAGYAPGNYHCKCADCEATFEGDKRAIQCLPCALTASGYRILGPGDDEDPHEVVHVYEDDGGVIIRGNGNVSTFGVQSAEVITAFNVASGFLDAVTVEKCAAECEKLHILPHGGGVTLPGGRGYATAIRALCATHQGGK